MATSLRTPPPNALSFYSLDPWRVVDTRLLPAGAFAAPALSAAVPRDFPLSSGACRIPSWAAAYSLNATVVPDGSLGFLTLWPGGQPRPLSSTLNSLDASMLANAASIQAGTLGDVSAFATNLTHLILDVNGFLGAPGNPGELRFFPTAPCRIVDTRLVNAGTPLQAGETREFSAGAGSP